MVAGQRRGQDPRPPGHGSGGSPAGQEQGPCTPLSSTPGDFVIVINAEKIAVTGRKLAQKEYYAHSGYPGGLRTDVLKDLLASKPEEVIKRAVWGMIPKNKLGRAVYKKLKVYRETRPTRTKPRIPRNTGFS